MTMNRVQQRKSLQLRTHAGQIKSKSTQETLGKKRSPLADDWNSVRNVWQLAVDLSKHGHVIEAN